jgi:hypothetical protein
VSPLQAAVADIDRALRDAGFTSQPGPGIARWEGRHGSRSWCLMAVPRHRTRYLGEIRTRQHTGWTFNIETETEVATQLQIVGSHIAAGRFMRWLYRRRGQQVLHPLPGPLQDFSAVAAEAPWAQALLARPSTGPDLAALLALPPGRPAGAPQAYVMFSPRKLLCGWQAPEAGSDSAAHFLQAVAHLSTLARTAEALPPPLRPCQPSRLANWARERPVWLALALLGGGMLLMALAALLLLGVAALVLR